MKRLALCDGGHCRKALRNDDRILKAVESLQVDVTRVGCQKVCRGPVVGIEIDGRWEWFERMNCKKALRGLRELVVEGSLRKSLWKRRDRKRSGKRRS